MNTPSASSLRLRLEEIDASIASFHSQLAQLAATRRDVVDQLKCITYPVLALPVEITQQIFIHYAQDPIDFGRKLLGGPFILASICQRWRTVALRLHRLWSRFVVPVDSPELSGVPTERLKEKILLCLEYSGQIADLEIDLADAPTQRELITLFTGSASQCWSRMELYAQETGLKDTLGPLPRLRTLAVWRDGADLASQIAAFEDAPMLREVQLSHVDATMISLPWAQLTTLSLFFNNSLDSEGCLHVLRQTPLVATLHLRVAQMPLPESFSPELHLEHLRTLTFEWPYSHNDGAIAFLELLTTPSLVKLTSDTYNVDSVFALRDLLLRSNCSGTLRSLTLKTNARELAYVRDILGVNALHLDELTVTEMAWFQLEEETLLHSLTHPAAEIGQLSIVTVPVRLPYSQIASAIAETSAPMDDSDSERTGAFRSLEINIPEYDPLEDPGDDEDAAMKNAVETLKIMAASGAGPKIRINPHKHLLAMSESSNVRLPPPLYSLTDGWGVA
ncbi:hypothetical protein C8F01DRAFT_1147232 [Mycena amicta]|nr:hypothetical protein C8F01DRAFT_1147232 [Mycena amicta]